jgi:integrase
MTVERRADRADRPWRVRWREEGRHRSRSFASRRAAVRFDAETRLRLEDGGVVRPRHLTLDEWLERWFDTHGPGWSVGTQKQREWTCDRHVSPHLGGVRLTALTRGRLREWKRDLLLAGVSAKGVNAASRVLSAALTGAADEELIPLNPLLGMRALPTPPADVVAVPLEAVERILSRLPDRDRRIVGLMAFAGLRPQELRLLTWTDLGPTTLWVGRAQGAEEVKRPKSAAGGRTVDLRAELVAILEPRGQSGLIAEGERGGVLDWHNWAARVWRPALKELGIGQWLTERVGGRIRREWECPYVPYSLRHTYASLRIAEGATVVEVAAEMGHANPATTLTHYAHLFAVAPRPASRSDR